MFRKVQAEEVSGGILVQVNTPTPYFGCLKIIVNKNGNEYSDLPSISSAEARAYGALLINAGNEVDKCVP